MSRQLPPLSNLSISSDILTVLCSFSEGTMYNRPMQTALTSYQRRDRNTLARWLETRFNIRGVLSERAHASLENLQPICNALP